MKQHLRAKINKPIQRLRETELEKSYIREPYIFTSERKHIIHPELTARFTSSRIAMLPQNQAR